MAYFTPELKAGEVESINLQFAIEVVRRQIFMKVLLELSMSRL